MRTRWGRGVFCLFAVLGMYGTNVGYAGVPGTIRFTLRDGTSITSVIAQPMAITFQPCTTLTFHQRDTLPAVIDLVGLQAITFTPCSDLPTSVRSPLLNDVATGLRASISPNPASNGALIDVSVSNESVVSVHVVDMGGRIVRQFEPQQSIGGRVRLDWDTREENGRQLPSATYVVVISTSTEKTFQLLQLLR